MELEDFNGWNLPFTKTIPANIKTGNLGYIDYKLLVDMSAYFSVIMTPIVFEPEATINYDFTGVNPIILNGKWVDVDLKITGATGSGAETTYTITLKCFIVSGTA